MLTAIEQILLPTTVTGSWPRPRWFDANLGGRSVSNALIDNRYREQFPREGRSELDLEPLARDLAAGRRHQLGRPVGQQQALGAGGLERGDRLVGRHVRARL